MSTNFSNIKEGDEIIYDCGSHYGFLYSLHKVARVTATQIKLDAFPEAKFRRTDGYRMGDGGSRSWTFPKLKLPTPELIESIERNSLCGKLSKTKFETLSIETLRAIKNLIP